MKLFFKLDIQKFTISNRITHNTVAAVRRCSVKKVSLEITQHLQENTCARVSFLIKLQALKPATLFKRRLWHRCFPVNVAKFLRIPFLQNTSCGCFWWKSLNVINWLEGNLLEENESQSLETIINNYSQKSAAFVHNIDITEVKSMLKGNNKETMLLIFLLILSKGAHCPVVFIVDTKDLVFKIIRNLMNTCSNNRN